MSDNNLKILAKILFTFCVYVIVINDISIGMVLLFIFLILVTIINTVYIITFYPDFSKQNEVVRNETFLYKLIYNVSNYIIMFALFTTNNLILLGLMVYNSIIANVTNTIYNDDEL